MIIKIGDRYYDSNVQPIIVVMDDVDKQLISEMGKKKIYCRCPDGIKEFMHVTSEKSKEQYIKDIDNQVLKAIDILQSVTEQYSSWDLWDKSGVIDSSLSILKERYEKELMEEYLNTKITWFKVEDKLPEENQECIIEIEYTNKLNIDDVMYNHYEAKYHHKYWLGKYEKFPKCDMKVTRWRLK
jgi:hypothetical protein